MVNGLAISNPSLGAVETVVSSDQAVLQKHMPELDVLRGLAILVVVLYHGLYWSGAVSTSRIGTLFIKASVFGWLGVNLFFVLSGFLISGILLDSKGRSNFYRRFYLRRVFRILPAYWATILSSARHAASDAGIGWCGFRLFSELQQRVPRDWRLWAVLVTLC